MSAPFFVLINLFMLKSFCQNDQKKLFFLVFLKT